MHYGGLMTGFSPSITADSESGSIARCLLSLLLTISLQIDDFHEFPINPTALFYPKWWLELVGYWPRDALPEVPNFGPTLLWQIGSHVLSAALGAAVCLWFLSRRRSDYDEIPDLKY